MLVFIDESGIHKIFNHSTVALVYVAVENLEKLNYAILKAEKDLGISSFHWSRHIWKIRQGFLKAIKKENFTVTVAILKNPFTEKDFELALRHFLIDKTVKSVVIDGKKPRRYILRLKQVLRSHGISVKKIRMGDDRSFPCLRLADLYAGLARAYFEEPEKEVVKNLYILGENKITTQIYLGGQVAG